MPAAKPAESRQAERQRSSAGSDQDQGRQKKQKQKKQKQKKRQQREQQTSSVSLRSWAARVLSYEQCCNLPVRSQDESDEPLPTAFLFAVLRRPLAHGASRMAFGKALPLCRLEYSVVCLHQHSVHRAQSQDVPLQSDVRTCMRAGGTCTYTCEHLERKGPFSLFPLRCLTYPVFPWGVASQ